LITKVELEMFMEFLLNEGAFNEWVVDEGFDGFIDNFLVQRKWNHARVEP